MNKLLTLIRLNLYRGQADRISAVGQRTRKLAVVAVAACKCGNFDVCSEQRVTGILVFVMVGMSAFLAPVLKVG